MNQPGETPVWTRCCFFRGPNIKKMSATKVPARRGIGRETCRPLFQPAKIGFVKGAYLSEAKKRSAQELWREVLIMGKCFEMLPGLNYWQQLKKVPTCSKSGGSGIKGEYAASIRRDEVFGEISISNMLCAACSVRHSIRLKSCMKKSVWDNFLNVVYKLMKCLSDRLFRSRFPGIQIRLILWALLAMAFFALILYNACCALRI